MEKRRTSGDGMCVDRQIYDNIYDSIFIVATQIHLYINQSMNRSMALSASCAGHTRTQSHAALYKKINEVVVGWWRQR